MNILTAAEFSAQGTSPWAVVSIAATHERISKEIQEMKTAPKKAAYHHRIANKLRAIAFEMEPKTQREDK